MEAIAKINIDLLQPDAPIIIYAAQNDSQTRGVEINLSQGKQAWNVPSQAIATFAARKPDGYAVFDDAQISGSRVTYVYNQQVLAAAGDVRAEVRIFLGTERLTSFNFIIRVEPSAVTDEEIQSTNYFSALQQLVADIQEVAGSAATYVPSIVNGWLLWSNNGDLPNPDPVYVLGADGVTYTPHIANGVMSWTNDGGLPNPDPVRVVATDGTNGATFTPAVSAAGVMSWTNDAGLPNPASVDLVTAVINALPSAVGVSF